MAVRKAAPAKSSVPQPTRPRSLLTKPRQKNPYRVAALRISTKRFVGAALVIVPGVAAYIGCLVLALRGELGTPLAAVAVWAVLVWRTVARLWGLGAAAPLADVLQRGQLKQRLSELDLGFVFIAATATLFSLFGGYSGAMYPLSYALVAYFAVFMPWPEAALLFAAMLGLEAAATTEQTVFISHVTFNVFFGVLYAVFLRSDIFARKKQIGSAVRQEVDRAYADARDYRLIGAVHDERGKPDAEHRRILGSVSAVREALFNLLAVGEKALMPRTLAVYALDVTGTMLRLKEVRGIGEDLQLGPISSKEGVFGGILAKRQPLMLTALKAYRGLTYYKGSTGDDIVHFMGVPIMEGNHVRGVLVADRSTGAQFTPQDVSLLESLAKEVARTLEVERLFSDMDRERRNRDKFYRASQSFSTTRTVEDVANAAWQAAANLFEPGLMVLTNINEDKHVVRAARGDAIGKLTSGVELKDSGALVNSALKTKTILPLPGVAIGEHSLLGTTYPLSGLSAARVFPLFAQSQPVGAWIVGLQKGGFSADVETMLTALSQQVAISLANASLNEAMERMATIDALTGLFNRRFYNKVLGERLEMAERYGRKLSVILCDIDHFKSVNDTYGHPVGDQVLKVVSRLLMQEARKTDAVGRLGGEEFSVVMSETDGVGGKLTAERMRERIQREVILTEHGKLSVTMSLGIATYPDDGTTAEVLISRADEALYRAKHSGRNRSVAYSNGR